MFSELLREKGVISYLTNVWMRWFLVSYWLCYGRKSQYIELKGFFLLLQPATLRENHGAKGRRLAIGTFCKVTEGCQWAVEARIRREDGIVHHEWQSHKWGKRKFPMSHEWLTTSDKWGILPILSSYPSFNNIPDRKVKTWKEEFSLNHKEIC